MESRTTKRLLAASVLGAVLLTMSLGLIVPNTAHASALDLTAPSASHTATAVLPAISGDATVHKRVRAIPTGNPSLDALCKQIEDLINDAYEESDELLASGDAIGSIEAYGDGDAMLEHSEQHTCQFTVARLAPTRR